MWLPAEAAAVAPPLLGLLPLLPLFPTLDDTETSLFESTDLAEVLAAEGPTLVDRPVGTPATVPLGIVADLNWAGDGSLLVALLAVVVGLVLRAGDAATLAREDVVGL